MSEELKPCPFCGCDMPGFGRTQQGTYFVNCPDCLAHTGGVLNEDRSDKEMAAAAWNLRTQEPPRE